MPTEIEYGPQPQRTMITLETDQWRKIYDLLGKITAPNVPYSEDPLRMANLAVYSCCKDASSILAILPPRP